MVGQREARGLEVDEIQRLVKRFDLAAQIRRKKNLAAPSEFDLPALPLGVRADAPVRFHEAVFGDVE